MATTLRILRYLKPYWRRVVLIYVCLFSALALQLTIPTILARAIDDGIIARDVAFLTRAALLIIGLTVAQGLFTYVRSYFVESTAYRVAFDLRNELYVHLQRLSFSFHDKAQTGQMMSRGTEDINHIRSMLVMTMRPLVMAIGTLIAVTIILVRTDLLLAVLALLPMPFLIWYSIRFGVSLRPMFLKAQQQFGAMTSALQENVAGNRVVRAFAQERAESQRFEAELEELFDRNLRAARRWAFSYPLTLLISGIGLAVVMWFGALQVVAGVMTIGTLVAFNRYITMLNDPVRWLGMIVNRIARAIASADRLFETLDSRPAIKDRPGAVALGPIRGEVAFEDVSFAFPGTRRPALTDISFVAPAGSVTALVGGTGGGKSAILSLIPRFYDVSSGRVLVDGHDVREVTIESLRTQIGIVMQETFLFSITIRENIAFGRPDATMDEVIAAAKAAQAHEFISAIPLGYDTVMGERGVTLSGGQKQRLAIARALLLDPHILLLDDATSSVDTETEHAIQQALQTLMQGRTSFIIAQRLLTVQHADLILVVEDGRIVDRGTHNELLERPGVYRDLYDLQLRDQEEALQAMSEQRAQAQAASDRQPAEEGAAR